MEYSSSYNFFMFWTGVILVAIFLIDTVLKASKVNFKSPKIFTMKYSVEVCIFAVAFLVYYILNNHKFVAYNNYSYFAEALLNGKLSIPDLPAYLESVEFGGNKYMHFAPGPAIVCIPFVALFGVDKFNPAWLCMALGAANAVLFYKIFTNMNIGKTKRDRIWFSAFATFGTVHFFLATVAHSWFFGHVITWFYLLVGMYFITSPSPKKPMLYMTLSGLFFGLAVTCRISNLLSAIFFIGYIMVYKEKETWLKSMIYFALGAVVPGGLYMLYNFVRFGTIMDKGYNLTHLKDKYRDMYDQMQALPKSEQLAFLNDAEKQVGGPLQLQFVKYNLFSIFLMMPEFTNTYPYVIPTMAGVSITALSPSLYFFLAADWKKKFTYVLLACMVICGVPFLLNYGNGMSQFGMRYAMDFLPYMIILACMGMKKADWWKTLIITYCIFANAWGPIFWRFFYLS